MRPVATRQIEMEAAWRVALLVVTGSVGLALFLLGLLERANGLLAVEIAGIILLLLSGVALLARARQDQLQQEL